MPYSTNPPEPDLPSPERDNSNPLFAARVHIKYMDPWQDQADTRLTFGTDPACVWVPTVIDAGDGEYGGLLVGSLAGSTLTSKWLPNSATANFSFSPSTVSSWGVTITSVSCSTSSTKHTFTIDTSSGGIGKTAVVMPYKADFPSLANLSAYTALGKTETIPGSASVAVTVFKHTQITQYAVVICTGSGASLTPVSLPTLFTP